MLINGIEEFLSVINSNEKLRPFLKKYPFTANEIAMGILVIDKNKRMVYDPHIGTAGLDRGRICFNTIDNNEYEYKLTEMEDYETALKIVKGSKN